MSRDGSGSYTLPSGNPVVSGTTITASWANTTLSDMEQGLTDSLDRNGRGAMLAELEHVDGSISTPGISWANEASSGLYRASAGNCRFAILGADVLTVTATGLTVTGVCAMTSLTLGGTAITASAAELNYVDGVTSSIQDQLDAITGGSTAWGDITGTLSNQTDLNSALALKAPLASPTFTGTTTIPTADINGGNVDGTAIGAAAASTGAFTTLDASGAATFAAEIVEEVYALSGTTPALNPANGTIQTWTLSGNSTPTDSLAAGEYITMHILDGTAYTITWPTMEWIGGAAPTLDTTNENIVELWKVGSTLYGALVGVSS